MIYITGDTVRVVPYQEEWAQRFQTMERTDH